MRHPSSVDVPFGVAARLVTSAGSVALAAGRSEHAVVLAQALIRAAGVVRAKAATFVMTAP